MKRKGVHRVAAVIFGVIALLHLLRLVYRVPVVAGSWSVPLWPSAVALVVAGVFAGLLWRGK